MPFASLLLSLLVSGQVDSPDQELVAACDSQDPIEESTISPLWSLLEELDGNTLGQEESGSIAKQLIARGPGVLAEIYELLSTVHGSPALSLTDEQVSVLDSVVTGLGRTTVASFVDSHAEDSELKTSQRQSAMQLLGLVGQREELETALLLSGSSNRETVDSMLRQPLYETVQALLRNDPGTRLEISKLIPHLDPTAASSLVRAIGSEGSVDAWDTLFDLLGGNIQLDRVTLSTIAELAQRWPGTAPEFMATRVAAYLTDVDPMLVCNALKTLGALDAPGLHSELIDLLGHEEPEIAFDAHKTLIQVTGLDLPADAARWSVWLQGEQAWWLTESEFLFREIDCGQLTKQCAALKALTRHRLERHQIAERILPLLEFESPQLRDAACQALADLGAMVAVPALEDLRATFAPDHPAHESARQALVALLGVDAVAIEAPEDNFESDLLVQVDQ